LAKLNLFGKKIEAQNSNSKESDVELKNEQKDTFETIDDNKSDEKLEELPILEYKETLFSTESTRHHPVKKERVTEKKIKRTRWESVKTIEENIDTLNKQNVFKKHKTGTLEKKIDHIIEKKHRKPPNVIYVVSRPQPGQLRGDWAVRSHRKIYSHHRKKIVAIKAARKIAKFKDATVMIQKTNGTFSRGFKPRTD
jgi:hypothetical protein